MYELQQAVENTITISTDATSPTTGFLDKIHTCEGADTSPPLRWEGVPAEAKSLALILDDPASDELEGFGLWTHWVLYSIPPSVTGLPAGQAATEVLENGAVHGMNGYEKAQYSGPCPTPTIMWSESIERRTPPLLAKERPYFFKLYALDKELDLGPRRKLRTPCSRRSTDTSSRPESWPSPTNRSARRVRSGTRILLRLTGHEWRHKPTGSRGQS